MIDQMAPWLGEEELFAVDAYLRSGGWLTEHDKTTEFENVVAQYLGVKHCVATTSGTTALFLALEALGIGEGDEVIVPAFTQTASAGAVELTGATPVFVDIEPETLCIDLAAAEKAMTHNTKALMVVSLNGRAPGMLLARLVADRNGLYLIEDAAQALGSCWNRRPLGTFGNIGCFSFSSPKVITTGQGGMVATDDPDDAQHIRMLKNFAGMPEDRHGLNFKFTDLQAVIGIEQMKKLDWRLQRKREMFALYRDLLADVPQVKFLPTDLENTAPWFIDILVPDPLSLDIWLLNHETGTRSFYQPLAPGFPNADYAAAHGLWLPSGSYLEDCQIMRVCIAIREFYA